MNDDKIPDDDFLQNINASLSQSEENIDTDTRAQLRKARKQALGKLPHNNGSGEWSRWMLPGGAALATLTITVVIYSFSISLSTKNTDFPGTELRAGTEDIFIISAQEDLELYEDLEFYEWLVHENERG